MTLHLRRRLLRPRIETLESRVAPSDIGVKLTLTRPTPGTRRCCRACSHDLCTRKSDNSLDRNLTLFELRLEPERGWKHNMMSHIEPFDVLAGREIRPTHSTI
jgi:hypothetical protein